MHRTRRPLAAAAAAAVWLGAGMAYAPAAHAAPPTVAGTPPVGDSLDTIGPGKDKQVGVRHYGLDRPDLATQVFFGSALMVPDIGSDGMFSSTKSPGGQPCSMGATSATGSAGSAVVANGQNAFETCPQQTAAVARLERYSLESLTTTGRDAPVLLRVTRVPAVENVGELPADLPKSTRTSLAGTPGTVAPGASLLEPAAVTSGQVYELQVTTSRPQFFALDVDWGQTLAVQVEVPDLPDLGAAPPGLPQLQVSLLGPTLNEVADGIVFLDPTNNRRRVVTAPPVVWRSYARGGASSFLAGRHVIAVGLPEQPIGRPVTLTYRLTVQVEGDVRGVPRFAGDVQGAGGQAARPVRRYAAAGLGVAGALMLVASGVIWARSRRA